MRNCNLERVVSLLLTERFPNARVQNVIIKSDIDADGDRFLRITVVLESDPESLDRDNLVSFVRYLRPKLAAEKAEDFPVISFVSAKEAGQLHLEAA